MNNQNNKNINETEGVVLESLPNTLFKVDLGEGKEVLAYLSGKMRLNRIKVLIGDRVRLIIDPYGGRARITRRIWPKFFLMITLYLRPGRPVLRPSKIWWRANLEVCRFWRRWISAEKNLIKNESQSFGEKNLRQMQNHQKEREGFGDLSRRCQT